MTSRSPRELSSTNRIFPVGLYALLTFAAFGALSPELLEVPERWLRTVVALPLRAYSVLGGSEVSAAEVTTIVRSDPADALWSRQRRTLLEGARGPGPEHRPLLVPVLRREGQGRFGADELVLSVRAAEVADCAPLVTAGNRLLGFLYRGASGRARVRLLHWQPGSRWRRSMPQGVVAATRPVPARVFAELRNADLPKAFSDRTEGLRMLVEPARSVEDWALRCTTLDDPYLASRLRRSGAIVYTRAMQGVPGGLALGGLKIWGYPKLSIPVGLYVEPSYDGDAVSAVVLWRRSPSKGQDNDPDTRPVVARGKFESVRLMRLPARPERWLCTTGSDTSLRPGAAIVRAGVLLGTVQEPWSGQALARPLEADAGPLAALFLPHLPDQPVRELRIRVLGTSADGRLRVALLGETKGIVAGRLYTGANGPGCPAGLLLGELRKLPDRATGLLRRPELDDDADLLQVFVPETSP